MEDRIYRVVSDVMGVPVTDISDESSPDTIEAWESLSHINLVLALESEFGISLAPEDVLEMLSVGLIKTILSEKVAA
ncbi:MAG: acyl carrier protein [SAR202 cluster bacterium]|nr:acyl carrier protein [SAR202 cluster bacterium]